MILNDICTCYHAKRACEVALAGQHSILFIGPWESEMSHLRTWLYEQNWMQADATAPCPCGYYDNPSLECTCGIQVVADWQRDGIFNNQYDIMVEVPVNDATDIMAWMSGKRSEPDSAVLKRIEEARQFGQTHFDTTLDGAIRSLLKTAITQLHLSYRQTLRVVTLARTIANLAHSENIQLAHLAEALQYRPKRHK
jgi:magnesium chelatase family protein